ncbi:Hypothetical predicted protein [Paramuricea clavata]|uniref:Uncharacterized protein n=1 Tax=Paramuricea clavata TaxID=317549 RepID=A0A6S7JDY8_PARCT|nr:Hypothetical predicted protein [Paramuricea clavata]
MFADDTQIATSSDDIKVITETLNRDLNNVANWLSANKLTLNNNVKIEVQPIENPIVEVKVLYVPSEVPNKVVAEFLGNHGKVETITREMTTEHGFPMIESWHVRENCPELQHPRVTPTSADNPTARVASTAAPVTAELMEADRRNVNPE